MSEQSSTSGAATLDKLAILLSGICIIHCLLAPIAITLLPIIALNAFWEDVLFHQLMLWLVIPTSSIALFIGCRKHRDFKILGTGVLGMALLVIVAIFGHDALSSTMEKTLTSIAGLVLATSHYLNYRACQSLTCSDKNCTTEHHH